MPQLPRMLEDNKEMTVEHFNEMLAVIPNIIAYLAQCVTPEGKEDDTNVEITFVAKNGPRNWGMSMNVPMSVTEGIEIIEGEGISRPKTVLQFIMPANILKEAEELLKVEVSDD